jgi:hypothetical protein
MAPHFDVDFGIAESCKAFAYSYNFHTYYIYYISMSTSELPNVVKHLPTDVISIHITYYIYYNSMSTSDLQNVVKHLHLPTDVIVISIRPHTDPSYCQAAFIIANYLPLSRHFVEYHLFRPQYLKKPR